MSQGSSARAKQPPVKGGNTKNALLNELSPDQDAELSALAAMPDDEIDTSDAPEVLDWTGARRGLFYTPNLPEDAIRLDQDVAAWFRSHANGQAVEVTVNETLRQYVTEQSRKAG